MARPTCPRKIGYLAGITYFKPARVKIADLKEVVLGHDEVEAIRLKNLQGLSQEEAAEEMNVSQPTFHRLLSSAYNKMTDAIVNGKALRIEGGNVNIPEASYPDCGKGRECQRLQRKETSRSKGDGTSGAGAVKVAITSIDGTMEGMVDERFGRAKMLIIYDPTKDASKMIENTAQRSLAQGAGMQTAQNILSLGIKVVITGHLGPNAFKALEAAGVEAYTAVNMTASDALKKYQEGLLERLSAADVGGHW
jgi:predicted DNA-binding protein (UPF0251 family)/predicted Fe-Mo cluster-binding NifX family protein